MNRDLARRNFVWRGVRRARCTRGSDCADGNVSAGHTVHIPNDRRARTYAERRSEGLALAEPERGRGGCDGVRPSARDRDAHTCRLTRVRCIGDGNRDGILRRQTGRRGVKRSRAAVRADRSVCRAAVRGAIHTPRELDGITARAAYCGDEKLRAVFRHGRGSRRECDVERGRLEAHGRRRTCGRIGDADGGDRHARRGRRCRSGIETAGGNCARRGAATGNAVHLPRHRGVRRILDGCGELLRRARAERHALRRNGHGNLPLIRRRSGVSAREEDGDAGEQG